MVKQLYDKLVTAGGDATLVTAYVYDDNRIAERLYYHWRAATCVKHV